MIECKIGNIEEFKADAIVNASNGIGYMGGFLGKFIRLKGVAESLHYSTKGAIEKEAKAIVKNQKLKAGDVFITSSGGLKAKRIFHAVTMDKPGQKSSLEVVERCIKKIIKYAHSFQFKNICIPALGTGTGRLDKKQVAEIYFRLLKNEDINFIVVDPVGDFNKYLEILLKNDEERYLKIN